ncbi:MAG: class II aldolase/adducin family protein [Hydrogenophaga sp.]|uniref:class II aldolase/adducin family protein n=1 Tax=Hydrogenophaga sp. TaxID=1904254 RepID=UPI003D0E6172
MKSPVSMRERVSEAEWATRVDLAACYRLVARHGMADLIYNHITARVPGEEGHFLINPFGFLYEEITASCLFKIDLEGRVIERPDVPYEVNHAGFVIHSAVHAARHDVACVIHTHTRAGMAVSVMECGLLPATQGALRFHDRLSYHDFEGPAVDEGERARLVSDLGSFDAMVLRNHGLLTCGRSIAEAFLLMQRLEMACRVQIDFMGANTPLRLPTPQAMAKTARVLAPSTFTGRQGAEASLGNWSGQREWSALLRQLDRADPSYQH